MGLDHVVKQVKQLMAVVSIGSSLFFGCSSLPPPTMKQTEPVQQKSVACIVLDLEELLGSSDYNHHLLHKIVDKVQANIPVKDNYSFDDKVVVLKSIESALKDQGFQTGFSSVFYKGLEKKKVSSSELSCLYVAVGKKMNLPLNLMLLPDRAFIVWNDVIWDSSVGRVISDNECIDEMKIPKSALDSGLYLKSLDKKQECAFAFAERGKALLKNSDEQSLKQAVKDFTFAITLEHRLISAYVGRGAAYLKSDLPDLAMSDAVYLINKYPDLAEGHILSTSVNLKLLRTTNALEACEKAISLNPHNIYLAEAHRLRVQINQRTSTFMRFKITDINFAIQLDPEEPSGYFIRGNLRQQMNDLAGAEEDFNKYQELKKQRDD